MKTPPFHSPDPDLNSDQPVNAPVLLDARGLRCPLPVIKMESALRRLEPSEKLQIIADDPIAVIDIPHFCSESGHLIERMPDIDDACVFLVTPCHNLTPFE